MSKVTQPASGSGGFESCAWVLFLHDTGRSGPSPLPPSSAVVGLAKTLKEPRGVGQGGNGSQICHLWGAGLQRNTDTNWGAGAPPVIFISCLSGVAYVRALSWLARRQHLVRLFLLHLAWLLLTAASAPPTPCRHVMQSPSQETRGTAQLATEWLCDLEQVAYPLWASIPLPAKWP